MAVVYESISNAGFADWDSVARTVVITKPTGLAAGDLMVAILASTSSPTSGWATLPSGFTYLAEEGVVAGFGAAYECSIYSKIADSGDAAATNFTFTEQAGNGSAGERGIGSIIRFSGAASLSASFVDASEDDTGGTTNNYTGGVDPLVADSIMLMAVFAQHTAGSITTSNYAITTSNPTWTERQDVTSLLGVTDYTFAIATGPRVALTTTGDYSADFSSSVAKSVGILAAIVAPTNVTVSPSVITMTASVQAPTVSGDANVSTSVISMTSSVQAPTVTTEAAKWTNESKSAAPTWTNEPKT